MSARKTKTRTAREQLAAAGTRHLYVDSGDVDAIDALLSETGPTGLDGNTVNQPLLGKELAGLLDEPLLDELERERNDAPRTPAAIWSHGRLCAALGRRLRERLRRAPHWDLSLQVHMATVSRRRRMIEAGRALAAELPGVLVKIPFHPAHPQTLLAARDLAREGIGVNVTSTFSARQVVAVALLTGAARTNVFLGRLNSGLSATLLGEATAARAQAHLGRLRSLPDVPTELICASLHEWTALVELAGCDAFTAGPRVLRALAHELGENPRELGCDADALAGRVEVDPAARALAGPERIAQLTRVDEEWIDFLVDYRQSREYASLHDGDLLRRRLEEGGLGDLFHWPTEEEDRVLRGEKLPDLENPATAGIALDTLFSLHANADFAAHQVEIDAEVRMRLDDRNGRRRIRPSRASPGARDRRY